MSYSLEFDPRALKEWQKLGETTKAQFKKKLAQVLTNPTIPKNALSGLPNCHKIKLKTQSLRLVYQVIDDRLVVLVIVLANVNAKRSIIPQATDYPNSHASPAKALAAHQGLNQLLGRHCHNKQAHTRPYNPLP